MGASQPGGAHGALVERKHNEHHFMRGVPVVFPRSVSHCDDASTPTGPFSSVSAPRPRLLRPPAAKWLTPEAAKWTHSATSSLSISSTNASTRWMRSRPRCTYIRDSCNLKPKGYLGCKIDISGRECYVSACDYADTLRIMALLPWHAG